MKALLEKYKWPLVVLIVASAAGFIVVYGFGDALGIDPAFRDQLSRWFAGAWSTAVSLGIVPLILREFKRDTDGDGTPDWRDPDANGNGKADGTTDRPGPIADELEPEVKP